MRILLVSHPPLVAEAGASQTTVTLATALRERGHDALAWSPEPLPADTHWWNLRRRQRCSLEGFVAAHGPFDVIDTPPTTASRSLDRAGCLVVRSIQPELLYLADALSADLRRHPSPRSLLHALVGGPQAASIVAGWRRARLILCLGNCELAWMQRRFPCWAAKLRTYFAAPIPDERPTLLALRFQRAVRAESHGVRFLWIGRWASHKGLQALLDFFRERSLAFPADTLTIAGCGATAEREIPKAWLISGRVQLIPHFSRSELPALLARHDAGLFTSVVEGWGLSLNEMLESGMPVFATEAGAVADLRPYFPVSLHSFPPPAQARFEPVHLEDLEANGYLRRFSWTEIARRYEEDVLAACRTAS
jgi:glycosyltransferase involved in cell wall biosynthesis